jgi:F-type H+-transporting ATPase subunit delta
MSQPDREKPTHDNVMDVTEERIARVYAEAFLGAVATSSQAAETVAEFESFVNDVLANIPQLEATLRSEFIDAEQKENLLGRILGGRSSTEMLNFLKVLAIRGRLGLLRPIARILRKLYDEQSGRVNVEVRVASELDSGIQRELQERLRVRFKLEPMMKVVVDPSLIAGIVIRVGDKVYDGSVKTRFEMLRKAIIERASQVIETHPDRFIATGA